MRGQLSDWKLSAFRLLMQQVCSRPAGARRRDAECRLQGRVDEDGIRCILCAVRRVCRQDPDHRFGRNAGGPGFLRDLKCFERVGVNGPLLRFEAGVPG